MNAKKVVREHQGPQIRPRRQRVPRSLSRSPKTLIQSRDTPLLPFAYSVVTVNSAPFFLPAVSRSSLEIASFLITAEQRHGRRPTFLSPGRRHIVPVVNH